MAEYKPKLRRKGLNPPFGYYPSKEDPNIMLPNKHKLNALEHSFRMRAKYNTSIRDCCMWLQANTDDTMTPAGYMYAYKRWRDRVRTERFKDLAAAGKEARQENQRQAEELFGGFTVQLDDTDSVYALARQDAAKETR